MSNFLKSPHFFQIFLKFQARESRCGLRFFCGPKCELPSSSLGSNPSLIYISFLGKFVQCVRFIPCCVGGRTSCLTDVRCELEALHFPPPFRGRGKSPSISRLLYFRRRPNFFWLHLRFLKCHPPPPPPSLILLTPVPFYVLCCDYFIGFHLGFPALRL